MKATLLGVVLATMMLVPITAEAVPTQDLRGATAIVATRANPHPTRDGLMGPTGDRLQQPLFTCSTGGTGSLLVAGALAGLLALRRRKA